MQSSLNKRKILFVGYGLTEGRNEAIAINTLALKKKLQKIGTQSEIFKIGLDKKGSLWGIASPFLEAHKTQDKIEKIITKKGFTHIHDTFVLPGASLAFIAPLKKKLPHVVFVKEIQNDSGFSAISSIESILRFFFNRKNQIKRLTKIYDSVFTRNRFIARKWKIMYVNPEIGIYPERKYQKGNVLRICFLGHPLKKKGVDVFPEIFRILPEKNKKQLIFSFALSEIGPREEVAKRIKSVAEKQNVEVKILKEVRPYEFFRQNDVLFLPLQDQYGAASSLNTIFEAIEAGCLVVTTLTPVSKSIIKNKATGILLKSKKPTAYAKIVSELISNKINRSKMTRVARQDLVKNFSTRSLRDVLKIIYP